MMAKWTKSLKDYDFLRSGQLFYLIDKNLIFSIGREIQESVKKDFFLLAKWGRE